MIGREGFLLEELEELAPFPTVFWSLLNFSEVLSKSTALLVFTFASVSLFARSLRSAELKGVGIDGDLIRIRIERIEEERSLFLDFPRPGQEPGV